MYFLKYWEIKEELIRLGFQLFKNRFIYLLIIFDYDIINYDLVCCESYHLVGPSSILGLAMNENSFANITFE
jgi:hypothetical protein